MSVTLSPVRVAVLVGLLYLVFVATFTVLTPAWENNDEPSHVQYAEYVVAHGTPPPIALSSGVESHQAPLYYYLVAGWQKLLRIPAFSVLLSSPTSPTVSHGVQVFLFSHDYTRAERHQAITLHELRLVSVLCGLIAVLAAVTTAWMLTERLAFAGAVGTTVALWPKFLVVTAAVTNSALVTAMCALSAPVYLRWRRDPSWKWAGALGAVLGAASLSSEAGLPIAGLLLLLLVIESGHTRNLRSAAAAIISFALVAGWWFVRETIVYGDPLASTRSRTYLLHDPALPGIVRAVPALSWSILKAGWHVVDHSTWYDGGWNQLQLPHTLDTVTWVAAVISLIAALVSRLPARSLILATAVGAVAAWLAILRDTAGAEGRYLLVGIVAWAVLLVRGAERIGFGHGAALWAWPTIMLALNAYVLTTWVIPNAHI